MRDVAGLKISEDVLEYGRRVEDIKKQSRTALTLLMSFLYITTLKPSLGDTRNHCLR